MTDEELLKRLGTIAREQRDEAAPEDAPALDEGARSRITDRLAERVAKPSAAPRVVSAKGRAQVYAFVAGGLALAAALVLVLRRGPAERGGGLPAYTFDESTTATMRGSARPSNTGTVACKIHAQDHAAFVLVARPEDATMVKVDAYAFAVHGADVTSMTPGPEVSDSGAVKLAGETASLVGVEEVRIVVGRDLGPEEAREKARAPAAANAGSQVLRCAVVR